MKRNRIVGWLAALALGAGAIPVHGQTPTLLDQGYREMYNLQFAKAHEVFGQWQRENPDDPIAPASDAAAFLFSEFDRLHVLEVELFVDDTRFESRHELTPDASIRQKFDASLTRSGQLANRILARDPANA